ncbi:MAG TPA: cyanophycin synthetase, partial [Gemmatimonadetes bacterium]|nr:cyanophycin synthetase [Gemmatimonadota bacterium]
RKLYVFGKKQVWENKKGDRYLKQLEDPDVQAMVLEAHFGLIARMGFPWQDCDVGICTNVTLDHVGRLGIETLDEMATLKRSVPDRARHVVLNADDPR